ncbi:MAG: ATP-binding protein, partial [Oscillospiraceae bacterium]
MGYDKLILSRATERLGRDKERRLEVFSRRQAALTAQLPELAELDRALRGTVTRVIAAALSAGEDPAPAVEEQRKKNLALQARRAELLRSAGYDPASLDPSPACPRCGDSGWTAGGMCDCLKKLCIEEQAKELSKLLDVGSQSFATFNLSYYSTIPGESGRSPRETMERVLSSCRDYADNFSAGAKKNLYLYGNTGLGKTFLSAAIAKQVAARGFSVVYDTATNIFAQFEQQKFSRDVGESQDAKDETRRYLKCDLLIVDDLGSEFATPFVQSALYTLVNSRLVSGGGTVISSNLTMVDAEKRYSPQVLSRLKGEYKMLPFVG